MTISSHLHAPASLPPGKNPGTHRVGGWVGPTAGLDVLEEKSFASDGIRTPDRPARSLVTIPTLLPKIWTVYHEMRRVQYKTL